MNIKERLTSAFTSEFKEGVESTKDMIDSNGTSFDDMAMASNAPGAFSDAEITDTENLNNEANMARSDNTQGCECKADEENPLEKATTEITKEIDNLVDISEPKAPTSIKVVKTTGDVEEKPEDKEEKDTKHDELLKNLFGESKFGAMVAKHLHNKTCEEYLKESFYDGPLDFVPDTRFNVSDVLNTLKAKIGDDATAINVVKGVDPAKEEPYYVVSQVDVAKLPKQITVENTTLALDGNTYYVDKANKDFPVKK